MSFKTKKTIVTILLAVGILFSMVSCSPKYGCDATKDKVGFHPYNKNKAR